jgi:hypothetical protein
MVPDTILVATRTAGYPWQDTMLAVVVCVTIACVGFMCAVFAVKILKGDY